MTIHVTPQQGLFNLPPKLSSSISPTLFFLSTKIIKDLINPSPSSFPIKRTECLV